MKRAAIGLVCILLAAFVGWVIAFGATPPCEAMKVEARKLAATKNDALGKAIADHIATMDREAPSPVLCVATAVRMKVFGRSAIVVVGLKPDAPKPETAPSKP